MKKETYFNIFCYISGVGIILFLLYVILIGNTNACKWLVMEHNNNWQFSDFFRQIVYASDLDKIYFNTLDAPFPPLAYCFFHILWRMNPIGLPIRLSSWAILAYDKYNLLIFLMITVITLLALYIIIKKTLSKYKENKLIIFFLIIIFSAPFLTGAIERGNAALLVLVMLLFAMYFKDSDNKVFRELALILIAISAGFKIYPAIFGLLYVKEKRWKEVFRLVIYGIIFFFIPFIFTGGIDGAVKYFNILKNFETADISRWTSIRCFFTAICKSFNLHTSVKTIGMILENTMLVILIVSMFIEKKNWKRMLFLALVMSTYVSNSHRYTAIYMIIPLIYFLKEFYGSEKYSIVNCIYAVLFAFIFTIPIWAIKLEVDFAIFLPIYLLLIIGVAETTIQYTKEKYKQIKKNTKKIGI